MSKSLGLWGLLTLLLFLMPASAMACALAPAHPVINISTKETPVEFDLSQSVEQLNVMQIDTKSPFPSHYHTDVGGVMSGQVALEHAVKFEKEHLGEQSCVSIKEINIEISISPTIYIASDFHDQACWFKQIFMHEAKHVEVDRAIMQKYAVQMTDAMNLLMMEPQDYSTGWMDAAALDTAQYDMRVGVEHALGVMFNKMMNERMEKQMAIDTVEEYAAIGRACPSPSS